MIPHGRQNMVTDARNGTTTNFFNNADLVAAVSTPNPGTPGGAPERTTNYYNKMLQVTNVGNPDGTIVTNVYLLTGELGQTSGSRTYPVAYTFDYAGRMKTMQTWTNFAGNSGSAITTWNYDAYRGFLTNKSYADNNGPSYTYTPAGRLKTRAWARGVTTTNSYGTDGSLTTVAYSDSTPGASYAYNRLGRQTGITQNGITTTLGYNLAGEVLSESYSGGTLAGLSVTNGFDQWMRRTNLTALNSGTVLVKDAFGYDNASRLQTVTDNSGATAYSAAYGYVANSALIGQITFKQGTTTRMTTTNQFDYLNRLTQKSSVPSGSSAVNFNYAYNLANQRTYVTNADGSFWAWTYDNLGQVTSGKKYWSDGTLVAGQQFTYGFDDIGNRRTASRGGDQNGSNLRPANYTANNLNQYTQRTVPGYVDVLGTANSNANVMVESAGGWYTMAYRKGEYFRAEVPLDNSGAAVWVPVTNIAVLPGGTSADIQTNASGNVFVPKTPEQFYYDKDGNLTNDGRWKYTWDAENRLVAMAASSGVGPAVSLKFEYDSKGRRIRKQVWGNTTWTGSPTNDLKFLYDGWNLVAILNSPSSLLESFLWGIDLSGSQQGAGGVGGLLEVVSCGATTNNCFAAFDGNGNVAALVSAADGTTAAQYEYGPFGEVLRATGPMAKANLLRFSTKYQDDESEMMWYPYRPCRPGSFLTRDPIAEGGGFNLYGFVNNNPVNATDPLGLVIETSCDPIDDYLNSLGISFKRTGKYHYVFSGTDLGKGDADAKMIVTRMLFAGTVFTVSSKGGSATDNLKKHVEARLTIVRNALKANFQFSTGEFPIDLHALQQDAQAYFDQLNSGMTSIACQQLTRIIFETGNRCGPQGIRYRERPTLANLVWIPGDWGWIQNVAYATGGWRRGLEGENVIHTGASDEGDLFWGHFKPGVHPAMSEDWWFNFIQSWDGPYDTTGIPRWRDWLMCPLVGLERPTMPP